MLRVRGRELQVTVSASDKFRPGLASNYYASSATRVVDDYIHGPSGEPQTPQTRQTSAYAEISGSRSLLGATLGWHAHRPLVAQMCDRVIMRGIEECVHVEVDRVVTKRIGKRHREVL